jgi:hypothetical protein
MAINETAILASPIFGPIAQFMKAASVVAGGIFGIYIILLILRWLEYKRFGKVLRDMRTELRALNEKIAELQGKTVEPPKKRAKILLEKIKSRVPKRKAKKAKPKKSKK